METINRREYIKPDMAVLEMGAKQCLLTGSQTLGIENTNADPNYDVLSLDDEDDDSFKVCW